MNSSSIIVTTRMKPSHRPLICKSIPSRVEMILVYSGLSSNGRCRNLGASRAHRPILIFADDDIEFKINVLQKHINEIKKDPNRIIALGWRQWEAPRVLIMHRGTFDRIRFDSSLYLLESLDFLIRAEKKGFKINSPQSPYDGHSRAFSDMRDAWFWYQFNQAAFMLKHRCIPRNDFNPAQRRIIIKPYKFFFNPRTEQGIPTLYKSRRLVCRWIGALYYGVRKLIGRNQ